MKSGLPLPPIDFYTGKFIQPLMVRCFCGRIYAAHTEQEVRSQNCGDVQHAIDRLKQMRVWKDD